MTYLETLNKFYETGMEILDIKVAIEVECFFGTDNKELFETCCAYVKEVYLDNEWVDITYVTRILEEFLDNFTDVETKIAKAKNFYDYFAAREED
jgi:hypothetical protein